MNAHAIREGLKYIQDLKFELVLAEQGCGGTPAYREDLHLQYDGLVRREDDLIVQAAELLRFHEKEVRALREILGEDE